MTYPLNTENDGTCRTIKRQYQQTSIANMMRKNTFGATGVINGGGIEPMKEYRVRKLTPKETWRLMGFSDDDFQAAKDAGISDSQLYKQAGNSIVVNVLEDIYDELYKAMPEQFDNLRVSSFFSGIGAFEEGLNRLYDKIENE